ncbi:hypothetical protein ALP58_200116 [Pseudomonas savastanoi]|uniref:Transposase n=1 Tax=Pseudomonas savastanoi TaxID=29438 RepID=A0A3M5H939_PSESS|nr:hypothetical protein ALP58_200116 [Pseudomonas savastanoi]
MKRFIQREHRGQRTLLPESLDDYVSDTNPVRIVDVFVDELDLIVGADRKLTHRGCGGNLGLLGGSSCIHTKTASERSSST